MSHRDDSNTYIPVVSMCLNGGGMRRIDGESETFVIETAPTLRSGGNRTGGDRPPGTDVDTADSLVVTKLVPVHIHENQRGEVTLSETAGSLKNGGGKPGQGYPCVAVPILEAGARTGRSTDDPRAGMGVGEPGDPMFTLQSGKQHAVGLPPPIGFMWQSALGGSPSSDQMGTIIKNQTPAVAFETRFTRNGRGAPEEIVPPLKAQSGMTGKGDSAPCVAGPGMAVRRLTPRECERLQGFPDGYTRIPYRGKPAADGPRYKALGNSMAVPVMEWIGKRILEVDGDL